MRSVCSSECRNTFLLVGVLSWCLAASGPVLAQEFIRGDANCDGEVTIADACTIMCALTGAPGIVQGCEDCNNITLDDLCCVAAADADGNGDLTVPSDALAVVAYLNIGEPPLPPPFPGCGPREEFDMECEAYPQELCNGEGGNECLSDDADPEGCLILEPSSPAVGQDVTLSLFFEDEQVQIGPPDEPACFVDEEDNEICLGEDDVTFNADGSVTFVWTAGIQEVADNDGTAFVWQGDFERLSEVGLAGLVDEGEGCTECEPGEGGGDGDCESGDADPCGSLTMNPNPPVEGELVTIGLFFADEQVQIGPADEPICFAPDEICLGGDDVTFDADGSITFEWTEEMQARLEDDGWAWVWEGDFERLAEVSLQVLADEGEGRTECAGPCGDVQVPFGTPLGLGLFAAACLLAGLRALRRKAA